MPAVRAAGHPAQPLRAGVLQPRKKLSRPRSTAALGIALRNSAHRAPWHKANLLVCPVTGVEVWMKECDERIASRGGGLNLRPPSPWVRRGSERGRDRTIGPP